MKIQRTKNITKRFLVWALIVSAILMIPVLANFPWTARDFIFAGVVLYGSAATYELLTRNLSDKTQKIAVGFAVLMVVLLIWAWAVA